ncbi:zinc finger protein 226 [Plutella xylostella]|uniref:zinc finger protein 226 n=1 Tax=Plutella xylostella TaxID=51655 RepID=UPI0020326205|nr:zinc finger protein 226 [Plutella xylostella]
MCDMQNLPSREDDCEEEEGDMNFAFTSAGASGLNFAQLTNGQLPVAKLQQNVANSGATLQQVVQMVGADGVQYVRAVDGGLSAAPQLITLPIALPGAKPGDPQQQIQIQVLNPNLLQQQQPKYQMQIPIQGLQGFQQGGAVLTVAYTPEGNDGSMQLIGNALPEGLQLIAMPQEMQMVQTQQHTENKEQIQIMQQPQVFITQNQEIIINNGEHKMESNNNEATHRIIIKEECDDTNDDESSQGTDGAGDNMAWQSTNNQDLINYLNKLPPQQAQSLPVSLQQFLKLNPIEQDKKPMETASKPPVLHIEINPHIETEDKKPLDITEAILGEDGTLRIKKKKKYKKKPPKPAKPKPGQVIITQADDGSPIYCCPECSMAYPEKEQLEMHLSVHKVERRFICGICGAGLKRKEHLERHKLGHNPERPYVCSVCCKGFKRREHLNLHTVIHSGVKTEMCQQCGKGFYRKDHLRKHARSHERGRPRDEPAPPPAPAPDNHTTEITIHVPTSGNMQVPVQINIPQHVVTSLQQQQALSSSANQTSLDALLAQHS